MTIWSKMSSPWKAVRLGQTQDIEEKRLDLELTAETRRSLQRKQKFMDKLMS